MEPHLMYSQASQAAQVQIGGGGRSAAEEETTIINHISGCASQAGAGVLPFPGRPVALASGWFAPGALWPASAGGAREVGI
ncbi:hypothetical protein OsJ_24312 [Oryza sativa Japonica Group]|uniref:Uncharacterized protein n=1 Tax=Oryza sativa subsp. japonica TaxID=39947 RepID=A3BJY4_ORYSJ|nr:hypothetical protein OsJ_24312 [Oryza sativa Japonica Group]